MPRYTITTLGVLVALLPFLGFPGAWKSPVYFLFGISIAYLSFQEHRPKRKGGPIRRVHRKTKGAVTLSVNGESTGAQSETSVITSLIEPNEESKTSS